MEVIIIKNNLKYLITGIYRSPYDILDSFLDNLDSYVQSFNSFNNHIICGDINTNIL